MIQLGGFLGRLSRPLLRAGLPLVKRLLIPLGLTAAASVADAGVHKKILGSGHNTMLIISNKEMEHILKIVKSLEDSELLLEGVSETIKNEAKEQKGEFRSILLGTLGASLLGNMLADKGDLHLKKKHLIPPHPLTNFETQMYYQNESSFNGAYSRDILPDKIKDGDTLIALELSTFLKKSKILLITKT